MESAKCLLFLPLLFINLFCAHGQENKKGSIRVSFSAGPNFSNLLNSEAPHKINIYGSDVNPVLIQNPDISTSSGYYDYNTSLIKDMKMGLSIGLGIEYFINNDLSLFCAIRYDEKGIHLSSDERTSTEVDLSELFQDGLIDPPASNVLFYQQTFERKISNDYVTVPVLLRKYSKRGNGYLQGGLYAAALWQSEIYVHNRRREYFPDYEFYGYDSNFLIDNEKDDRKENTHLIDYGIALGGGLNVPVTPKLLLNADLLAAIGLHKVDRKYDNEYKEEPVPLGSGVGTRLRSTNYHGLNSNAKYISMALTIGVAYYMAK